MARMGLRSVGKRYECSKCNVSADTRIIYHWYKFGHRGKSVTKQVSEYKQESEDIKGETQVEERASPFCSRSDCSPFHTVYVQAFERRDMWSFLFSLIQVATVRGSGPA